MAMIPQYDEMGNITGWYDPMAESAGGAEATPPPTTTTTTAPPPVRRASYAITDDYEGGSTQGPVTWTPGPSSPDVNVRPDAGAASPSAPSDGGGSTQGESFLWPEFDPGPAFQAPAPFSYDEFRAPSLEDAKAEPGYEFARSEGLRGLQNSAASRGVARTGGTLKDLIGWGNRFAEQNYGNVFNRAGMTYDRNRNNAADAYQTNYGISRDVFDRGYMQRKDAFAPKMTAASATFDDLYRRWRDELDTTTRIATAGAGL